MNKPMLSTLLLLLLLASSKVTAAKPPNVLFVVTDDQRFDTIAALGHKEVKTPTIDALVNRGVSFSNCYCMGAMTGAVCTPSRTMLMTGKSLWRIPDPQAKHYDGPTLGKSFRQAGYETLFCGKRGNTFVSGNRDFETVVFDESRGKKLNDRAHASQFMADTTLNWFKQHPVGKAGEKPFCIYLAPPVPHDPRLAPKEFMDLYDPAKIELPASFLPQHPFDNGELRVRDELLAAHPRTPEEMKRHLADYYAAITCFDHHLGRVIDALHRRGDLQNTLIVFTSDHGLAVGGMHGLMGKQNLYEHNKAPLVIAGPGIPAGKRSAALVYLFDLFPTVVEAAGLPAPAGIEGKSLMPVIRGQQSAVRDTLFGAYRDWQRMIRDERWKLITYHVGGQRTTQLFDLENDPLELHNLADQSQFAAERARLERQLVEARKSFGDPVGL